MAQEGFSVSVSMKGKNDNYDASFSYEDTEGREINKQASGDNPYTLVNSLADEILNSLLAIPEETDTEDEVDEEVDEYVAQLEQQIQELQEKNSSLERDISILQRRADDAVKDSNNEKDTDGFTWSSATKKHSNLTFEDLDELVKSFFRQ